MNKMVSLTDTYIMERIMQERKGKAIGTLQSARAGFTRPTLENYLPLTSKYAQEYAIKKSPEVSRLFESAQNDPNLQRYMAERLSYHVQQAMRGYRNLDRIAALSHAANKIEKASDVISDLPMAGTATGSKVLGAIGKLANPLRKITLGYYLAKTGVRGVKGAIKHVVYKVGDKVMPDSDLIPDRNEKMLESIRAQVAPKAARTFIKEMKRFYAKRFKNAKETNQRQSLENIAEEFHDNEDNQIERRKYKRPYYNAEEQSFAA